MTHPTARTVQRKTTYRPPIRSLRMPPLHWGQNEVVQDPHRFKVLACGRRWGKTRMCSAIAVYTAMQNKKVWWVAPSYGVASIGWRDCLDLLRQIPGIIPHPAERRLEMPGGGSLSVRSAAGQTGLRGEGLDLLIIDECAFVPEKAWTEALRPALADRQGSALLISTPKGRNWFWKVWLRGSESEKEWKSWQMPTIANPIIKQEEIDEAQRTLPELAFRQEFLAQFLEDAGIVFRKVMQATTAIEVPGPVEKHDYVMGVDWGKHEDFTVLTVLDATTRQMVDFQRFNQIDYVLQKGRLLALQEKWKCGIVRAERNSIGEPLIEELEREHIPVWPFTTTGRSKQSAIDALALAFEKEQLAILPEPVLVNELQAYEMKKTPTGMLRYTAPEGYHDDCVMSLALAWDAVLSGAPADVIDNPF
jgi:hypothetical protein